jgi:hypothetical protein
MKTTFTVVLLLVSLTSCSLLTKNGRQARAYRNYVRKSSIVRTKQQKKFHFRVPQMAIRQDSPMVTTGPEYPQSMTAAQSSAPDSFTPTGSEQASPVEQTSPPN